MRKFTIIALATASLLPLAAPALAQDVPVDDAAVNSDEEIIVQARRKDESLQEVPLSVQAVTGQDLNKLEIRNFTDITKVVPGLSLSGNGYSTSSSLRGVNFDARASGAATTVEFYRNDAVIVSNALFSATYDIAQIEVLRGPQGTLRGRASPSGSITVTTRRPDLNEVGGFVGGSVSERGKWNFNGALNVPIIEDKLAIRIAGFAGKNRGNNIRGLNVVTGAIDDDIFNQTQALRASVRADPFDGMLVLDFNYETIKQDGRQYNQVQSFSTFDSTKGLSPRTINVGDDLGVGAAPSTQRQTYKIYNWQAKFRQWGQALTYVGSKTSIRQDVYSSSDNAGLFGTENAGSIVAPPGTPISTFGQLTLSNVRQESHELRLQNEDRLAGMFDYVIGGFMVKSASPTIFANGSATSVSSTPSTFANGTFPLYSLDTMAFSGTYRPRLDRETSLFGNLTMHLGENTEISGGLRHIWFKSDSGTKARIDFLNPDGGGYLQRRCYGHAAIANCLPTKQATIYAASLKHNFTEDLMAYFSFGTSWRPGNSLVGWAVRDTQTPVYGAFIDQFLNLPDETSKSFEVGFKTAWLDRRLKFNVSAFYQKFNNYPLYGATPIQSISAPTGGVLVTAFNFASPAAVTVKGLEAELSFDISRNFTISTNFAFADAQAKNALVPCVDLLINATGLPGRDNIQDTVPANLADLEAAVGANQIGTCRIDGSPSSLPRFSGSVQAEYSRPIGDWGTGYLRGFVNWKGASSNDAINPNDDVSAYALVDLYAGIRDQRGAWELGAFVKNVFNTRRVLNRGASPLSTAIDAAGTLQDYGYLSINRNEPREAGISLRYAFGSR